jgi:hypothetical protein
MMKQGSLPSIILKNMINEWPYSKQTFYKNNPLFIGIKIDDYF